MPNDPHPLHSAGAMSPEEDFLSLRDIMRMILRHRWPIAIVVLLVTLAAGIIFVVQPLEYQAEGYLQVIAPVSLEGKVDKDLFETMIVSHLQRASSAFLAKNVSAALKTEGIEITPLEVSRKIKITRPPKTDLIRLVMRATVPDKAIAVVRQWIRLYEESIRKNNIRTALSQIHLLLKKAQADTMEKQGALDGLKAQLARTEPLITLSKAVDDRQLWNDLSQKEAPDSNALKKLSEIHIKGQEQNKDYVNLKMALFTAEQVLLSEQARRNFYQDVEQMLEVRASIDSNAKADKPAGDDKGVPSEAERYVQTILKSTEIVQFGEPGLISAGSGTLKKTGLVFIITLMLAGVCAFLYEWGKGILSSR